MYNLYKSLKKHFLEKQELYLSSGLVSVEALKDIVFGTVDLLKSGDTVASLYPEEETLEEGFIDKSVTRRGWTLTVAVSGGKWEDLLMKMCEYGRVFKAVCENNYSISEGEIEFEKVKYYPDCGFNPRTVCGVEVSFSVVSGGGYEDPFKKN